MDGRKDFRITTNQELAYFMVDALGVQVIELIFPDSGKSRWMIIHTFNRKDSSNPNCFLTGFDITEFFSPSRMNKSSSIIRQELNDAINKIQSRTLEFSDHFGWFLYKK